MLGKQRFWTGSEHLSHLVGLLLALAEAGDGLAIVVVGVVGAIAAVVGGLEGGDRAAGGLMAIRFVVAVAREKILSVNKGSEKN